MKTTLDKMDCRQRDILLHSEPEDLANLCQVDKWCSSILQDIGFWKEYYQVRNEISPPDPLSICQYYLNDLLKVSEAEDWLIAMSYQENGISVDLLVEELDDRYIYHFPRLTEDLILGLGFDKDDEDNFWDFISESEELVPYIQITENGMYMIQFGHSDFDYEIWTTYDKIKIFMSRLLRAGFNFTTTDSN